MEVSVLIEDVPVAKNSVGHADVITIGSRVDEDLTHEDLATLPIYKGTTHPQEQEATSSLDIPIDVRLAEALARPEEPAVDPSLPSASSRSQTAQANVDRISPDYRALQQLASSAALESQHPRLNMSPVHSPPVAQMHASQQAPPQQQRPHWLPPLKSRYGAGYRQLAPAPRVVPPSDEPLPKNFFDLPAEIRIEIYKLVVLDVVLHILPLSGNGTDAEQSKRNLPHALARTSRQTRNEVLPILRATCSIRANVTDFNFSGMLAWMARIPPTQQHHLVKNPSLEIKLCTAGKPGPHGQGQENSLRKWLKMRADPYRPQPRWKYSGAPAQRAVSNDMRRKFKRMPEEGKREELRIMLEALKVDLA
ncbi:hypothetical protein LTR62_003075 [Meristemomyces frigidus]|uniref:Uncharacterized protein n=1 Tax=Meristemomyces frigidus TaxID=1508187 RepID=A0AAN7YKY4_9PEZI|nr:hypothetical protein LTR62_003075 [Meristemomyces frigidus]